MIELTDWLKAELVRRAETHAPEECCGLISRDARGQIALWAAENVAEDPTRAFRIEAKAQLRIIRMVESRGETLEAIYHSHAGSAAPSEQDFMAAAAWPDLAWVIVGWATCPTCRGYRTVIDPTELTPLFPGGRRSRVPCFTCDGAGTVPDFWAGVLT